MSPLPLRLGVVLSHPTQYYSPWFRSLQAGRPAGALRVFYLWDFGVTHQRDPKFQTSFHWDVDLLSGYESEFVPNRARRPGPEHFWGFRNPGLPGRLGAWRPEALLLFGYPWASHLRALAWARRRGVPVLFRGDSHFLGRPAPDWRRRLLLGALYRQMSAFLYTGRANRAYFETLGVPARKLHFAPHAVNHELYDPSSAGHRERAAELRRRLGLADSTCVVLAAGKLIPAKQPRELLAAFRALDLPDSALVFVGDGEEKPALLAEAASARPGAVHFLPFANQSEMPSRYLLADVFSLPSRGCYETWGLAVNEAMHMGVPCLVSDRVGCQQDLVSPRRDRLGFPGRLARGPAPGPGRGDCREPAGSRAGPDPAGGGRPHRRLHLRPYDGGARSCAREPTNRTPVKISIVTEFFPAGPARARAGRWKKSGSVWRQEFAAAGHEVTFFLPPLARISGLRAHRRLRDGAPSGLRPYAESARAICCSTWSGACGSPAAYRPRDIVVCNTRGPARRFCPWSGPSAGRVVAFLARMPKGHGSFLRPGGPAGGDQRGGANAAPRGEPPPGQPDADPPQSDRLEAAPGEHRRRRRRPRRARSAMSAA